MALDKINFSVWNFGQEKPGTIAIKAEKQGSKDQIDIFYSISFDELGADVTIPHYVDDFDRRVYEIAGAIWDSGDTVTTLTHIFNNMGYEEGAKPSREQIKRLRGSIVKMQAARISIDNTQEAAHYKGYDKFVYHGALLPCEFIDGITNGQIVDCAIHLFREPPLLTFAKQRKQVAVYDTRVLQCPINKTAANLRVESYLLYRIARAKAGMTNKILLSTLYGRAQITTSMQRMRAKPKIEAYLQHFKSCGIILGYAMDADSITLKLKAANQKKIQ